MSLPSKLLIRTTAPDGSDKPAIMRADTEMVLLASCDAVDCPAPPAFSCLAHTVIIVRCVEGCCAHASIHHTFI